MADLDALLAQQAKAGGASTADPLDALLSAHATGASEAGAAPAAVQVGRDLNSIPRALGLTARYGIEGLANSAQLLTEPIRALTDRLTGFTGKTLPLGALATQGLDALGVPKPETANERVVGDASRLVAGTGGLGAATKAVAGLRAAPQLVQDAANWLSANMGTQAVGAAGAGLAGGASREAGGSPAMQAAASMFGTVAGGVGAAATQTVADAAGNAGKRLLNRLTPQQMDQQLSVVLQRADVDYSQLPNAVRASLRGDAENALRAGQELDPRAVARLADLRAVGATPTRGMVTLDPVQITREQNLAKIGANSSDGTLQGLPRVQNDNNAAFIQTLNDAGAARGNVDGAGRQVAGAVLGQQNALRTAETAAWDTAKGSPGYRQPIESHVISDINHALGEEGLMPFMNPTISRYMEAFQTGQPFTPQAYRNLQSMLSRETAKGGNEAAAAVVARRVLEQSELQPIKNPGGIDFGNAPVTPAMAAQLRSLDAAPAEAIDAVNHARAATRAAYAYEDSSPLVRSVLSGGAASDPERIAQRFVVGGTANEAATLAREVGPGGLPVIRDALLAHLKEKSLGGATDEIGRFSQSNFNKALGDIGEQKLRLFFSPEEINQLHALGRASSYAQVQPVGSAVNNSNSGALLLGKGYDALMGLTNKVPFLGPLVAPPIKNIEIALRNQQAKNVGPALLASQQAAQQRSLPQNLLLPALVLSGGGFSPPTSP